jgi:hypothetical protein
MAWDANEQGNVLLSPLISYQPAILAEMGCGIRLVLARRQDEPETDPIVVQMAMSVVQAQSLVRDLQRLIDRILDSPPVGPTN